MEEERGGGGALEGGSGEDGRVSKGRGKGHKNGERKGGYGKREKRS